MRRKRVLFGNKITKKIRRVSVKFILMKVCNQSVIKFKILEHYCIPWYVESHFELEGFRCPELGLRSDTFWGVPCGWCDIQCPGNVSGAHLERGRGPRLPQRTRRCPRLVVLPTPPGPRHFLQKALNNLRNLVCFPFHLGHSHRHTPHSRKNGKLHTLLRKLDRA